MIPPHDELAVGIGLRLPDFHAVVLVFRQQGVVVFHGPSAVSHPAFRHPGPGIRMAEDGAVLLDPGIHPGDEPHAVVPLREGGGVQQQPVGRIQPFLHRLQGGQGLLPVRRPGNHGPGRALQVHFPFLRPLAADGPAVGGVSPQEPLSVPQLPPAGFLHLLHQGLIFLNVFFPAQVPGRVQEVLRGPYQQEGHHGAFPAPQVQAVVPVRPEPFGDPVGAYLGVGKVQPPLHMVPDGPLPALGEGNLLLQEGRLSGLPHVFRDGRNQPQMVVRAGVLDAVDPALAEARHHRGRLPVLLPVLLLKPGGIKQMQPVSGAHLPLQQLQQPLFASLRLRPGDAHGVLGRVPVSQPRSSAHLDEGGEPGKQHVDLRLIQIPDIQAAPHVLVGNRNLQASQLFVPEAPQLRHGPVAALEAVPFPGPGRRRSVPPAQEEQHPFLLARAQRKLPPEGAHRVSPQLRRPGQLLPLQAQGIPLRPVGADEGVPGSLEAVRRLIRSEELEFSVLIMQVADHRVSVPQGSRAVQAHLKILVVKFDMMEGKFHISVHADLAGLLTNILHPDVYYLHRVGEKFLLPGDQQRLGGLDAVPRRLENRVAQPVPAAVSGGILPARGLPAEGPVLPVPVVPQIDPVPRPLRGQAVGPEPGDPSVFRSVQPAVSAGLVADHRPHPLGAQIVGQGLGTADVLDHIFSSGVVKASVPHGFSLL